MLWVEIAHIINIICLIWDPKIENVDVETHISFPQKQYIHDLHGVCQYTLY